MDTNDENNNENNEIDKAYLYKKILQGCEIKDETEEQKQTSKENGNKQIGCCEKFCNLFKKS